MNQSTIVVTAETAQRWAKALDRAISNGLDVLVSTSGEAFVESASVPGLIYSVSREHCSCPAGAKGQICQHRACFMAQIGELPLEPSRIVFDGNSDRKDIMVDGRYYGFAAFADDSGWTVFQGKFPHARKRGAFCTLAEVERHLEGRLPVSLPVQPEVRIVEVAAAVA